MRLHPPAAAVCVGSPAPLPHPLERSTASLPALLLTHAGPGSSTPTPTWQRASMYLQSPMGARLYSPAARYGWPPPARCATRTLLIPRRERCALPTQLSHASLPPHIHSPNLLTASPPSPSDRLLFSRPVLSSLSRIHICYGQCIVGLLCTCTVVDTSSHFLVYIAHACFWLHPSPLPWNLPGLVSVLLLPPYPSPSSNPQAP